MSSIVDFKSGKRIYPRTNNDDVLEFIFERDPNLFLRKNKISIHGTVTFDKKFNIDTGFAAKLFSKMTVEVESQSVSPSRSSYVSLLMKK